MTTRRAAPPRTLLKAIKAPFGYLEQREAERLRDLGLGHEDRLLVVMLRIRLDGRDNWCHDSIAELVKWTGISAREMTRAVGGGAKSGEQGRLVKLKIVELGRASTVRGAGGRGGLRTYRPRRVRPFKEWLRPDEGVKVLAPSRRRSQSKKSPASEEEPEIPARGTWLGQHGVPQVEHLAAPQDALGCAPGALTPETPPEISPKRDALTKKWLARRPGRTPRWLAEAMDAQVDAGAEWGDVERAVDDHIDEYVDAIALAAWVATARDQREEHEVLELETQRNEERERRNRELDEIAAREDADPVIAAQKAALRASIGLRLKATP